MFTIKRNRCSRSTGTRTFTHILDPVLPKTGPAGLIAGGIALAVLVAGVFLVGDALQDYLKVQWKRLR